MSRFSRKRIAHFDVFGTFRQLGKELVIDSRLYENTRSSKACLALVPTTTPKADQFRVVVGLN